MNKATQQLADMQIEIKDPLAKAAASISKWEDLLNQKMDELLEAINAGPGNQHLKRIVGKIEYIEKQLSEAEAAYDEMQGYQATEVVNEEEE